jgi:hypothetical protein
VHHGINPILVSSDATPALLQRFEEGNQRPFVFSGEIKPESPLGFQQPKLSTQRGIPAQLFSLGGAARRSGLGTVNPKARPPCRLPALMTLRRAGESGKFVMGLLVC